MRIGIDGRLWNESGVGRYTRNLVRNLVEIDKKNDYVLFVQGDDSEHIQQEELSNSNGSWKLVAADIHWHTLSEQFNFPQLLQKEKIDLMHFPYFSVPIFYDRPFVVTIHDLILHHFSTGQASTLPLPLYKFKLSGYKYVVAQAAKRASKIITVSESVKEEIIKHLKVPKTKVVVTYEGVDEQVSIKNNLPSRISGTYFLYVGNAYPHKNLGRLIEAFSEMLQTKSELKLVLVGREDYFYKRLMKHVYTLGLQQSILFLRFVSDSELAGLYQHAAGLVVPSLMEGFSLPPLEAMSQNCLPIVSAIDVHQEICKDAAIYFNPEDKADIAKKMMNVLDEKMKTKTYIEKGHQRVMEFSWSTMAKQTLAIYQECLP